MEVDLKTISREIKAKRIARIKLLGDSITHGVGGTDFCQNGVQIVNGYSRNPNGYCWANLLKGYLESKYNCLVFNNACTGTNIEFIIGNYEKLVDKEDDFIICMIGTNNRHQLKSDGERQERESFAKDFYEKILLLNNRFKKENKTVLFMSSIPASKQNEEDGDVYWRILHMDDINAIYKAAFTKSNFLFVSLYDLFNEYLKENQITCDALLCDGLHPNDEGHRIMFELIRKELLL